MERFAAWVQVHRWRALAGLVAVLSFFVFMTACIPRVSSAYGRYRTWRQQQAKVASAADWEAQHLHLSTKKQRLQQRPDFCSMRIYPDTCESSRITGSSLSSASNSGTLSVIR